MKKNVALGILITMLTGLLAKGAEMILDNKDKISRLQENRLDLREDVKEIKQDVKYILKKLK